MREPRDNNAHATGTEDDNDSPAVGLLRLNVLPERLVEEPPHVSYGDESVCNAFRSRVGWLGLFLVGLWSAAFIIDAFEHTLQANVELAHFVPLIIGQGGNAGSQAVSSVIRGLAGKEIDVHSKPTGWVVAKESAVGALCGLVLGTFVLVVGYVCHPNPNPTLTLTLNLTLALILTLTRWATFAASSRSTWAWSCASRCRSSACGPTCSARRSHCWPRASGGIPR